MSACYTVKIRAWDGLFDIECVSDEGCACPDLVLREILQQALKFMEKESLYTGERALHETTWRDFGFKYYD